MWQKLLKQKCYRRWNFIKDEGVYRWVYCSKYFTIKTKKLRKKSWSASIEVQTYISKRTKAILSEWAQSLGQYSVFQFLKSGKDALFCYIPGMTTLSVPPGRLQVPWNIAQMPSENLIDLYIKQVNRTKHFLHKGLYSSASLSLHLHFGHPIKSVS